MCHHFEKASLKLSNVSRQLGGRMSASCRTIDFSSIMAIASEIAKSPTSAGTSGTPSNSSRSPNVPRGAA